MAVGTQYHTSTARHHLSCIGVYDALVDRHIDSAVTLCGRKTEYMVVLVYGATYSAEAIMTVCHCIGDRELFEPTRPCGLNDTDVGDVV